MALIKVKTRGTEDVTGAGKNLIINGGMQCWQRATSATTVTPNVGTSYNTVDRFFFYEYSDGSYTTEQSTGHSGDTGHDTALKCVCTGTDTSLAATQFASVSHRIEAQNLQHLKYGTSGAKTLTCSFWVRSSKTGIYSFSLVKNDGTAHYFVSEYTINSANTWEQKTISIPALTGSSINNDSGVGFSIEWSLAYGSQFRTSTLNQWMTAQDFASTNQVNWLDSTSNNWYLTGVQLEVGDTATDFEHRSFADELLRCKRYYEQWNLTTGENIWLGTSYSGGNPSCFLHWQVEKRGAPSVTLPAAGQSAGTVSFLNNVGGYPTTTGSHAVNKITTRGCRISGSGYGGIASGIAVTFYVNSSTTIKIQSEL